MAYKNCWLPDLGCSSQAAHFCYEQRSSKSPCLMLKPTGFSLSSLPSKSGYKSALQKVLKPCLTCLGTQHSDSDKHPDEGCLLQLWTGHLPLVSYVGTGPTLPELFQEGLGGTVYTSKNQACAWPHQFPARLLLLLIFPVVH